MIYYYFLKNNRFLGENEKGGENPHKKHPQESCAGTARVTGAGCAHSAHIPFAWSMRPDLRAHHIEVRTRLTLHIVCAPFAQQTSADMLACLGLRVVGPTRNRVGWCLQARPAERVGQVRHTAGSGSVTLPTLGSVPPFGVCAASGGRFFFVFVSCQIKHHSHFQHSLSSLDFATWHKFDSSHFL